MPEGFRYTESGDLRVTEGSDFRITENAILAEAALYGDGSSLFAGLGEFQGLASLSGSGGISASATLTAQAFFAPYTEFAVRFTESGDTRHTEDGDIRYTNLIDFNIGEGLMQAVPTLIPFTSGMYVNVSDVWQMSLPYVKYGGEWVEPLAVYKKVSGNWKRVH